MDFFRSEIISPNLIRIIDISYTACYLVLGQNRACLIDTGIGFGNLRAYVDVLTELPYDVILTHGHFDHASGASQFADKKIYLHPADRALMEHHTKLERRLEFFRQYGCEPTFAPSDIAEPLSPEHTFPLSNGQKFDLGGITIEALHTPGHTQGMTILLMREIRTILFGDGCGVFVLLLEDGASTVEEYLNT